jgi:hypothetical protein
MEEEPTKLILKDNTSKELDRASKETYRAFEKVVNWSLKRG